MYCTTYIALNVFRRLVSTDFETAGLPMTYKSSAHRLCPTRRDETELPRQIQCETNLVCPRGDKETIKEVRNTEKYVTYRSMPCPSKRIIGMIKSRKFKILI